MEALRKVIPDTRRIRLRDYETILKILTDHGNPLVTEPVMSDEDWEEEKITVTFHNPQLMEQQQRPSEPAEPEAEDVLVINAPNDHFIQFTCSRCGGEGHIAKDCWEERDKSIKKQFFANHPEKRRRFNQKQRQKRNRKLRQ
jgi:hypothetical protein